jgi:hypothetical protein
MAKDATAAEPPATHAEKPVSSQEAVVSTQVEDSKATGGRRNSVALNVIENPLTVGLSSFWLFFHHSPCFEVER